MAEQFTISLKAARVNAKMTQDEAARAIGASREAIMRYETGRTVPRADRLAKLAKAYGVPIQYLRIGE
jgi:transcriptional regulator with XRE-family HTH domain